MQSPESLTLNFYSTLEFISQHCGSNLESVMIWIYHEYLKIVFIYN